ncbi:MAG: restriction endonuclease [Rhodanobacteraceae bacterium]
MPLKPNRNRLDDSLSRVDPTRFESLLAEHYRSEGWQVEHAGAQATGQRYDGGIDLKLRRGDEYVIVRCKRWNAYQVPHNAVHELLGILVNERASAAILATCGDFTEAAVRAAECLGQVQLLDGTAVRAMLGPAAIRQAEWQSTLRVSDDLRAGSRPTGRRAKRSAWLGFIAPAAALIVCLIVVGFFFFDVPTTSWPRLRMSTQRVLRPPAHHSIVATPPRAGQPLNPLVLAGHIAAVRADAVLGNSADAATHVTAISNDFRRSARIPDASRPIDHEAARAVARPLPGVRSAIWLDHSNFVVMVDGARYRTMAMIDRVCVALEPLGDTLAVVVHVQDATATTADGATTLSRNCQLPQGQRAFLQPNRKVDVISPELRATFKRQQGDK